jgi:hypothetical protein
MNELLPQTLPLTCTTCRACSGLCASQGQSYCLPEVGIEARFFVEHTVSSLHLLGILSL